MGMESIVEEDLPCFFFFPEFMEMVIFVFLRGVFLVSLMEILVEVEDCFVELLLLLLVVTLDGPCWDDLGLVS